MEEPPERSVPRSPQSPLVFLGCQSHQNSTSFFLAGGRGLSAPSLHFSVL